MTIVEILFVVVVFFANIIQSITGFAGTVLAMPVSINLVGYNVARPILTLVSIVISLLVVVFNFRKINWKKLLILFIFVGTGFGLGFFVQQLNLDSKLLLRTYGTIICMIATMYIFFKIDGKKIPKWIHPIVLILGGIMQFLYTSGGPLVVIFAASVISDKDEFRTTLSTMWLVLNSIIFTTNVVEGSFTPHVWILSIAVVITSLVSLLIGKLIVKKIDINAFMKLTYILLFISGVSAVL